MWARCNAGFSFFVFEVQVVGERIEALVKHFVVYDAAVCALGIKVDEPANVLECGALVFHFLCNAVAL